MLTELLARLPCYPQTHHHDLPFTQTELISGRSLPGYFNFWIPLLLKQLYKKWVSEFIIPLLYLICSDAQLGVGWMEHSQIRLQKNIVWSHNYIVRSTCIGSFFSYVIDIHVLYYVTLQGPIYNLLTASLFLLSVIMLSL